VTVRLLEIAEIEPDQAVRWYGAQAPGLGEAFLIEVLSAADRIVRFPEAWHPLSERVRRCRLSRFPHGLIYAIDNGDIPTIGAIACSDDLDERNYVVEHPQGITEQLERRRAAAQPLTPPMVRPELMRWRNA
jgi:hypothetical protein